MAKKVKSLSERITPLTRDQPTNGTKSDNPLLNRIGVSTSKKPSSKAKVSKSKEINPLLAALTPANTSRSKITKSKPINKSVSTSRSQDNKLLKFSTKTIDKQVERLLRDPSRIRDTRQTVNNSSKYQNIRNSPNVLTIKNVSKPNFLKLRNLELGTSSEDLKRVLRSFGEIREIKVQDLKSSGSTFAEIVFKDPKKIYEAVKQLNGAIADGRVLEAVVTNSSEFTTTTPVRDSSRRQSQQLPNTKRSNSRITQKNRQPPSLASRIG